MRRLLFAGAVLCALAAPAHAQRSLVDRSGTITLGGQAQQLLAAVPGNANRHGCMVQNLSSGDEWINDVGGTAAASQPSIWLPPGAVYTCAADNATGAVVSIYGATTGQAFAAREW